MSERQQVEIQGKPYQLIWQNRLKQLGMVDREQHKIRVRRGTPDDRAMATVLHEAIEVINDELKLKLDHDTIDRLESGLFCFLKKSGVDLQPLIREEDGNES